MAYTTIDKPEDYFNTVLYTGNGTAIGSGGNAITGVGFQPDWVWIKSRTQVEEHEVFDPIRGVTKYIRPSTTQAEVTDSESLTSFDADGFTVGNHGQINANSQSFVSWNWLADNTSGSSNTDGSITSTVSANTTSGFSIVTWTGNSTAGATIGHGLGVKPRMIITKRRDTTSQWQTYEAINGATKYLTLNQIDATSSSTARWNDTEPTTSVFSVGNSTEVNASGGTYVAYCFADVKGYSKIGSYVGNGNADGTFVYTGFKPAFVIVKRTDSTGNWQLFDNKRLGYNPDNDILRPNLNNVECNSCVKADIISNGFKLKNTDTDGNASGGTYIFLSFAENPFVTSTGIAGTAR